MGRPPLHGDSNSLTYQSWRAMKSRCLNPKADQYSRYGGAGITVCPRWENYQLFLDDMGSRPSGKHTIDRIKNYVGYQPGNCRWADHLTQQNNRGSHHILIYRGRSMTMAQAIRLSNNGLAKSTVRCRLDGGWSVVDALETMPVIGRNQWS
jgi:hypothetical protein